MAATWRVRSFLLPCICFCWEVVGTNAGSEWQHSRNRHRLDPSMKWTNFVSASYNGESKLRLQWQKKAMQIAGGILERVKRFRKERQTQRKKRERETCLHDVVKDEVIDHMKSRGHSVSITGSDFIEKVRERKAEIKSSPELKRAYDARLVSMSDEKKKERNAAQLSLPPPHATDTSLSQYQRKTATTTRSSLAPLDLT